MSHPYTNEIALISLLGPRTFTPRDLGGISPPRDVATKHTSLPKRTQNRWSLGPFSPPRAKTRCVLRMTGMTTCRSPDSGTPLETKKQRKNRNLVAVEALVRDQFPLSFSPRTQWPRLLDLAVVTSPTAKRKAVSEYQNVTGETRLSPSARGVLKREL